MAIRPEEITNIIKEKIAKFDTSIDVSEVGTVIQVGDGIARVYGLKNVKASELVDFGHGVKGMALGTDFHMNLGLGGSGYELVTAVAGNLCLIVLRLNCFLHDVHLSNSKY